jgi:poly(hydroxyalkanoate) granule-associated protein
MVKKLKAMADKKKNSGLFDSVTAQSVKDSAQQIWLAGMGAFAKAQAEGKQVFDALVKEGSVLQRKTTDAAGEVTSRMSSMAEDVSAKAGERWDKLESIFEERTAKALGKLGVPTAKEMQTLQDRIAELEAQAGARKSSAPRKTAAKKAGVKRAAKKAVRTARSAKAA